MGISALALAAIAVAVAIPDGHINGDKLMADLLTETDLDSDCVMGVDCGNGRHSTPPPTASPPQPPPHIILLLTQPELRPRLQLTVLWGSTVATVLGGSLTSIMAMMMTILALGGLRPPQRPPHWPQRPPQRRARNLAPISAPQVRRKLATASYAATKITHASGGPARASTHASSKLAYFLRLWYQGTTASLQLNQC